VSGPGASAPARTPDLTPLKTMFVDRFIASVLTLFAATSQVAYAEETSPPAGLAVEGALDHPPFGGPGSVGGQIQSDTEPKAPVVRLDIASAAQRSYHDFKERVESEYGLTFGIDYNLLYQHASKSPGEENAAGGALRLFGIWQLLDQDSGHPGSIEFKVENRHRLSTDVAPAALAGEIGYAGLTAVPFSDAGTILTNLYWHQSFLDNRLAYIVGIVDVTDYVGVYGLVNPWTDFINLAFSTDPTTPAPDQGFGAAVRWNPAEHYYVLAGLADANGNPRDPTDSVDGFFNDGEYFKHIEAGWFGSWESRFDDNIHLAYWHADERTAAGVPDGWGVQASFSRKLRERWLPFLRIGYAEGGGAPLDRSVSTGFAYYPSGDGSVFGLGINWGRPNYDSFGAETDDQYTLEAYYRFQLFERLTITPDLQLIKHPAQNPDHDVVWIAGLRARLTF
jgi:porin